jgi:hypothetical protein
VLNKNFIIFGKNLGVNNTVEFTDGCQALDEDSQKIFCPETDSTIKNTVGKVLSRSHYHAVVELPRGLGTASMILRTGNTASPPQFFNYTAPDITKLRFGPNIASASEVGTFAAIGGLARGITLEAATHRLYLFGENFGEDPTQVNITLSDQCTLSLAVAETGEQSLCPSSPLCPTHPKCMAVRNEEVCLDARWHRHQTHDWGNKGRPFLSCEPQATTVGFKELTCVSPPPLLQLRSSFSFSALKFIIFYS